MYDRIGEPVSLGIPFAQGQLTDSGQFGICNDGIDIAVQTDVTARWDDGSIKWLMAHFLADLPGNRAHDLTFATDGSISTPVLEQAERMMKSMRPGGSRSGKRIVKDLVGDTVLFDGSGPKAFASFYVPFMFSYKILSDEDCLT